MKDLRPSSANNGDTQFDRGCPKKLPHDSKQEILSLYPSCTIFLSPQILAFSIGQKADRPITQFSICISVATYTRFRRHETPFLSPFVFKSHNLFRNVSVHLLESDSSAGHHTIHKYRSVSV